RLPWPERASWATAPRFAPPLRRADAGALGSGGRRCRPSPARALDLSRSWQGQRHVLVRERTPRVARLGHTAPGAGAKEARVMPTTIALATLLATCCTDRRRRHKRASPPPAPALATLSASCGVFPSHGWAQRRRHWPWTSATPH